MTQIMHFRKTVKKERAWCEKSGTNYSRPSEREEGWTGDATKLI